MADLKTQPTDESVERYLEGIEDPQQKDDCRRLLALMRRATGEAPKMWGDALVGFGEYHYRYDSGREGNWFLTGFAPRKGKLSIYVTAGFERYDHLMAVLGTYKTGKSCLYLKRLDDVDLTVLEELIGQSARHMADRYASP